MAVSDYKIAQRILINTHVDELIQHVTRFQPDTTNYRIAQEFILSNIEGHTYPDTNENEVRRNLYNLAQKLQIHNQNDKSQRIDYLIKEIMKRKFKDNGISDTRHSIIHMLLLLQNNPSGQDEVDIEDFNKKRIYLTKDQIQLQKDQEMQELLKIKTEEDFVIEKLQNDWNNEINEMSSDNDSDWQEDNKDLDNLEDAQNEHSEDDDNVNNQDDRFKLNDKQDIYKKQQQFEDQNLYFGGMPIASIKVPIIKVRQNKQVKSQRKPKKFTLNTFLDKYLDELKPPQVPYEKYLEQKKQDKQIFEEEQQMRLKDILNIRTFDQIQQELSQRVSDQDLLKTQKLPNNSLQNPSLSCFHEPLNTIKDYTEKQHQSLGFWKHRTITERQLVMDTILLFQQLETPTFIFNKVSQIYEMREQIQVLHVTPKMLQSLLDKILKMANIQKETIAYLFGLKTQQQKLGNVFENLVFKCDQFLQRFNCEINDLQQIALLQAGQISKKQISFSSEDMSLIQKNLNIDQPITLLRLFETMEQIVFKKVELIHQVMKNGIMDYIILEDDQNLMLQELNNSILNSDDPLYEQVHQQDKAPQYKTPQLCLDKIMIADRVTYLLNYLYLVIKNNQLLVRSFPEINLLKELFLSSIEPYMNILADWVNKGGLESHKEEFFIKANPKIFDQKEDVDSPYGEDTQKKKAGSQTQWKESFIFRTVNLKELLGMGQNGPFQNAQDQLKVEISIPLFLRPVMKEILSIGKSVKIIRYLDKINATKACFEGFSDFKKVFDNKIKQEIEIIKEQSREFNYFDEITNQPSHLLRECAIENLNNVWDPSYSIGNVMNESGAVRDYRDLLNLAPFQWSLTERDHQNLGIFQLPSIQKNLNISFASTHYSETHTPEKQNIIQRNIEADVDMESVHNEEHAPIEYPYFQNNYGHQSTALQISNKNPVILPPLLSEENYKKISSKYSYSFWELANYDQSMTLYQNHPLLKYLTGQDISEQPLMPLKEEQNDREELQKTLKVVKFKKFTIDNMLREAIVNPIRQIHTQTCSQFIKRLNTQCNFHQTLNLLKKVFFMEAGAQMHQFCLPLFKELDKGRTIDNLIIVNGHFNESVSQSLSKGSLEIGNKMRVTFSKDPKEYSANMITAFDYLHLHYQSEWPLEIILDNDSIAQYNRVLSFLMKIKRVNYALSLKDYWIEDKIMDKKYSEMNVREQILNKNKQMLKSLVHQMQVFQKELLHFSNNLEYYIKTRAIQSICNELDSELQDIQNDIAHKTNNITNEEDTTAQSGTIDMDALIQIHQEFMQKIIKLCMLDPKSRQLLDVVLKVLQVALNFRYLCIKYLLRQRDSSRDFGSHENADLLDKSDDLGLNLSGDNQDSEDSDENTKENKSFGMGLLRIDSPRFLDHRQNCEAQLNDMKSTYATLMKMLILNLKRYTKKGVYSYLDEAFTRFNFNSFYMSREQEGLE